MRTRNPRGRTLLIAVAVLALAGAVSGLAAAGSSLVSTPQLAGNVSVPADKAAALARRQPSAAIDATPGFPGANPPLVLDPIPARILGADVPVPVPPSMISVTNGWLVSNGNNLVAVYAGAAPDAPAQGRVVIVRQDLRAGTQTVQVVDAGATGTLSIAASAPLGAAVETSALTGDLPLVTGRGSTMKLSLGTNTIGPG